MRRDTAAAAPSQHPSGSGRSRRGPLDCGTSAEECDVARRGTPCKTESSDAVHAAHARHVIHRRWTDPGLFPPFQVFDHRRPSIRSVRIITIVQRSPRRRRWTCTAPARWGRRGRAHHPNRYATTCVLVVGAPRVARWRRRRGRGAGLVSVRDEERDGEARTYGVAAAGVQN